MYREFAFSLGGAVVWSRSATTVDGGDGTPRTARIVPDGCIDLIWSAGALLVAGPDTAGRLVQTPAGVDYVAVRFPPGHAPAVLGVPADELRDAQPSLEALWPLGVARRLADEITAA